MAEQTDSRDRGQRRVALVAGATRGAGRGIVLEEHGSDLYPGRDRRVIRLDGNR